MQTTISKGAFKQEWAKLSLNKSKEVVFGDASILLLQILMKK